MDLPAPAVVGTARIPRDVFRQQLGAHAIRVWTFLCTVRDRQGKAHPSLHGIARARGYEELSERTTQRALARLRAAGLVEDNGLTFIATPKGPVEVFMRTVRGGFLGRDSAYVPHEIWQRVMKLAPKPGSGGARAGAGRPRKIKLAPCPTQEATLIDSGIQTGTKGGRETEIKVAPRSNKTRDEEICMGSSFPTEKNRRVAAPASSDAPKSFEELLARLKNKTAGPPTPVLWGTGGLPAHPHPTELYITVPAPPRVPENRDREGQLSFVACWYRSAVESRGSRCPPIRMAGQTRKFFEDALDVFLEKEIRPGAWVAWQMDRVLGRLPGNARRSFMPKAGNIFSVKTLTEQRWMFREIEANYCSPRFERTQAGDEFMKRFRTLEADLVATLGRTPEQAAALVTRHFPEGYYAAREQLRAKSDSERQGLLSRLQLFQWIWPVRGVRFGEG